MKKQTQSQNHKNTITTVNTRQKMEEQTQSKWK